MVGSISLPIFSTPPAGVCMKLKMKIGKNVVEQVVLNPSRVKDECYLLQLKETMRSKHLPLINQLQKQPMFYIEVKTDDD